MTYTFDENLVSDLHKDARSYRPSYHWVELWNYADNNQKQIMWDSLLNELSQKIDRERREQQMAVIAMHQRVQGTMLLGAKNEVQALKWIMEAEEFDDYDLRYGASYFCFHFGLPYSAEKEFPIQEAINEMLAIVV